MGNGWIWEGIIPQLYRSLYTERKWGLWAPYILYSGLAREPRPPRLFSALCGRWNPGIFAKGGFVYLCDTPGHKSDRKKRVFGTHLVRHACHPLFFYSTTRYIYSGWSSSSKKFIHSLYHILAIPDLSFGSCESQKSCIMDWTVKCAHLRGNPCIYYLGLHRNKFIRCEAIGQ